MRLTISHDVNKSKKKIGKSRNEPFGRLSQMIESQFTYKNKPPHPSHDVTDGEAFH
jgi:hypothetical protein